MNHRISMTNVSFAFLKSSSDFLNLVLNNINSCVLLLDKDMRLQAFNDATTAIFLRNKEEDIQYVRCGEAIGCAYQVEEMKDCGQTPHCNRCPLREAALISYSENKPVYREHIAREFYMNDGKKVLKHLQFSTRSFHFQKDRYILMIVDDISEFVETKKKLVEKEKQFINHMAHLNSGQNHEQRKQS